MAYYTRTKTFPKGNLARGENVQAEFDDVETGIASAETAIAALEAGDPPGWGGAIDTRWFAATTGAANTYSATPVVSPTGSDTIGTGYRLHVSISANNTGASTLDIGSSEGAVSIKKLNSAGALANLEADDLDTNAISELVYTGSVWYLENPPYADVDAFVEGAFKNLIVTNNATYPAYQMDIDAGTIVLQDSSGNVHEANSVNLTADITASGANGLDTGAEATSTWYYLWAIYNGTTVASLISASATAPTMPTGYTYKARVGAIYNNGSDDFIDILQLGRMAHRVDVYTADTVLSAGTATSYTAISPEVPTTARVAFVEFAPVTSTFDISIDSTVAMQRITGGNVQMERIVPLDSSNQFQYKRSSGSDGLTAYGRGWMDNL